MEIHRVQIKTTTTEEQGKSGKYGFALNHGAANVRYDIGTVDFFGLVVLPLHTIYIVPTTAMTDRVKAYVYPDNPESAGLHEHYKENWLLL